MVFNAAELVDFCRAIAPAELAELPLYIVGTDSLPKCLVSDCYAAVTAPGLDLALRTFISGYARRGPCILINNELQRREAKEYGDEDPGWTARKTVLHELGHVLSRVRPYHGNEPTDGPAPFAFGEIVPLLRTEATRLRLEAAAWEFHGADWIRLVLHLAHRAYRAGFGRFAPARVIPHQLYHLSRPDTYEGLLRKELVDLANISLEEVKARPAPDHFLGYFEHDVIIEAALREQRKIVTGRGGDRSPAEAHHPTE